MSVRPIDFNGMIQASQEVGNARQSENTRPAVEQQNMQIASDQQQQQKDNQVSAMEEKDDEHRYDTAEGEGGGNAGYHANSRKRQKKEEEGKVDRVVVKGAGGGFNITI